MRPIRRLTPIRMVPACCTAVLLAAVVTATTVQAAAPALQAQITLRPLTPQDIKDYALTNVPGIQGASGLSTVGRGQPAYLEVLVNNAVTNSDITNVTWTLTVSPGGSAALAPSPLGTNVPTYKMADRYNSSWAAVYKVPQFGGEPVRKLLRPDVTGLYTVTVTVQTKSSGSTNLTQNITASTYMGIGSCKLCHNGGTAPAKYEEWSQTPHATFFTRAIDGLESDHYGKNCISCHTVGYDSNTNAVNNGFDDVATQVGWTFPPVLTNGNWAAMTNRLQNLANIQCENCHGAGSEHAIGELDGLQRPEAKAAIAVSFIAGNCAQCHDSKPNHVRSAEWNNSLHARVTRTPSGTSRPQCVRCHTAAGFTGWAEAGGMTALNRYPTNIIWANDDSTNILTYTGIAPAYTSPATPPDTTYEALTCATCHDPHNAENPHQLRLPQAAITLSDGTTVTNAGSGAFCMQCHNNRDGSYTNMLVQYPLGKYTWAGGSAFGTHDSPQADVLEGVNAETYGKFIPSAAHANSVSNTCAGCHMQPVASTDPAFTKAGGHTFSMTYSNASGVVVDKVDVCVKCHGPITSFDMVKLDYNGDGVIEGVQTEVQHLLDKLSTLLPPRSGYQANPANYVADGLVKASDSQMAIYTNVPTKFLQGYYNWDVVFRDGSKGVHNAPFVVGLLKASIADLTGDGNNDGLPDAWQTTYFGSPNATNAGPNYCAAGDGVPNWLKYALGLDPRVPGITVPGGVVWADGYTLGGSTNTIQIYTAAEVTFDTEVGKTYQIESVGSLSAGWQKVGDPIPGTGNAISYVTPTRSNLQQFYRVSHTP
jgi:hypothetical protein